MTIHLERKIVENTSTKKYPYQRLSYDLTHQTDNSIAEISRVLEEFKKRSNGEFNFCVTSDPIIDSEGNITFGDVIYGEDFWHN